MAFFRVIIFMFYWLVSLPFYILNALQRHLSKPWRLLFKQNSGNDARNKRYRISFEYAKIPLYIVLTPLRFVNAVYYNLIVHSLVEYYNYLCEVIVPSSDKEGAGNLTQWLLWFPIRVVKYPLYHGILTLIESVVWTIVDTFVPALTLYHGTNKSASFQITGNPISDDELKDNTGVWMVGKGNFAGSGIYFVPERGVLNNNFFGSVIVARVSLGRVLDMGLAPESIYKLCGPFNNTKDITAWGLNNGYVAGEWCHEGGYWEYCLYDFQNRYNHSWRIRPLYVLDNENKTIMRIPKGMFHWLFRSLVMNDIMKCLKK